MIQASKPLIATEAASGPDARVRGRTGQAGAVPQACTLDRPLARLDDVTPYTAVGTWLDQQHGAAGGPRSAVVSGTFRAP